MDSMNSVLQKFFNLPPALRMMLAVAGFGSLAAILFFVAPALMTRQGKIWILIIAGIGLAVFLLIWGVRRLFFGRKSKRLSGALESQGPTRGDVAEQEQVYREKFRGKLAELKTNGLSVYRLPWFVLMGEPGCGKTASLIHSGLDFPLGKDEVPGFGGTRNYNWWFTNDAVILDTAGRISFHEEGTTDKTEWEYFLKLLRLNRPRCPINGIIVALPADKLLRDTPDERAQKATILRERLRQVHQTLGVRFPTFFLITKMDLVGGFSEFFEEIRVDLAQRNQMFGWSRPGEFQETFNPAEFPNVFDLVYQRLREWSMRYLQRKATEEELGLVVTFPEAFRELREPLNDFIGTIFQKSPLLEPPFFRGFYFTSAVQEGAPIFDVFAKSRGGILLPERPTKAVDSKAFFIHDFYEKKVFAEHGLVFRSAQHVTLNQRMRKLVWAGSAVLVILMLGLFAFGSLGIKGLVTRPQDDCKQAHDAIADAQKTAIPYAKLADQLTLAKRLQADYSAYDRGWTWLRARALFIGANIAEPRDYVKLIHASFVLNAVVRPILSETETRLESADALKQSPEQYTKAAETYTRWYGLEVGAGGKPLNRGEAEQHAAELSQMLLFLGQTESIRKDAAEQFTAALVSLSSSPRLFGTEILRDTVKLDANRATTVVKAAVQNLRDYWLPLTRLQPAPQDKFLTYWYGVAQRIGQLRTLYDETLSLAPRLKDASSFAEASQRFATLTDGVEYLGKSTQPPPSNSLARAYYDLAAFLADNSAPQTKEQHVLRFADESKLMAQEWATEFGSLGNALREGAPKETDPPQNVVYTSLTTAQNELQQSFAKSLDEIRTLMKTPAQQEPVDYYAGKVGLLNLVERKEGDLTFDQKQAVVALGQHPLGRNDEVRDYLTDLRQIVVGAGAGATLPPLPEWPGLISVGQESAPSGPHLSAWFTALRRGQGQPSDEDIAQTSGLADVREFWQPVELYKLAQGVWTGFQGRTIGTLLTNMQAALDAAAKEPKLPGVGRLMPSYDRPVEALPFGNCAAAVEPAQPKKEPEKAPEKPQQEEDWRKRRTEEPAQPAARPGEAARPRPANLPPLVSYHTRDFLYATLGAYLDFKAALAKQGERGQPVADALERATDAYIDHYFIDWNDVYDTYCELLDADTVRFLGECEKGASAWPAFEETLEKRENDMATAFRLRLEALVRDVALFQDAFKDNARYNAMVDRVSARFAELGPKRNLAGRLDALGRRAYGLRRSGDPVALLGDGLVKAWRNYAQQVRQRGADPKGADAPANARQLEKDLEELLGMPPDQFHLTAPLTDLARYGDVVLRHHLEAQLAGLLADDRERYPVVSSGRDPDPNYPTLHNLAERALKPDALLALLRKTDAFQQSYGKLLRAVADDNAKPYVEALDRCQAWVKFLYGADTDRLGTGEPAPLKVKWEPATRSDTASAGNIYDKLTVTLPLLDRSGRQAVGPIERPARSAVTGSLPPDAMNALATQKEWDYRWSLFVSVDYTAPGVKVSDKNPTAKAEYPSSIGTEWTLPGSPWSLLLLVGASAENRVSGGTGEQWVIPILLKHGDETIGFDLAIQFERVFPGPIVPPPDAGPVPKMVPKFDYAAGPTRGGS